VVEVFFEVGVDISIRADEGLTLLHLAALHAHDSVVTILLRAGADINTTDDRGWTAPHHAANNRRKEVVLVLLGKSANTDVRTDGGETALHVVARAARVSSTQKGGRKRSIHEVEELSLKKETGSGFGDGLITAKRRCRCNAVSLNGLSPLHLAARAGNQAGTDFQLQNDDAEIDATDQSGLTALHWAASKEVERSFFLKNEGHEGVAVLLLERGEALK
jgi:ankyrin repeat protein